MDDDINWYNKRKIDAEDMEMDNRDRAWIT